MSMHRLRHRWAAWTAVLALLWAALAPALADRPHTSSLREMLQVCSVMGTMMVPMDDNPSSDTGSPSGSGHCPWCSLQAHTLGLPAPTPLVLALPLARHVAPIAFLQAPRTQHAWTSARSRAPPLG
jgi:Protein of unknown function (DUF2946)